MVWRRGSRQQQWHRLERQRARSVAFEHTHDDPAVAVVDLRRDVLAPEAARIGAVNTVCLEGGRLVGRNTDGTGFLAGLRELPGATARLILYGRTLTATSALESGGVEPCKGTPSGHPRARMRFQGLR